MRILGIVITYYPVVEEVIENINQYIEYVDTLIIWENTPKEHRDTYQVNFPDPNKKVMHMSTGNNEGIANPINNCIEWVKGKNYSHILTMDQDSSWDNFNDFVKSAELYEKRSGIAIMTPNINKCYSIEKEQIVNSFIISGALFPIKVISQLGTFNEKLFVDGVDLEYSLRATRNNIKIVSFTYCHLKQNFGYPIKSKFFGFESNNYSAGRTYNIVKNHLFILRRYYHTLTKLQRKMIIEAYILRRIVKVILVEKDKRNKIKSIIKGCITGLKEPLIITFN